MEIVIIMDFDLHEIVNYIIMDYDIFDKIFYRLHNNLKCDII